MNTVNTTNTTITSLSPRLRMSRIAKPATDKVTLEIFATACAVLAGCPDCIKAHEANLIKHGMGIEHIHDVVRIAAVVDGAATALDLEQAA